MTTDNTLVSNPSTPLFSAEGNCLFPVFLQLHNLKLLIVGGGYVAMEKLQAVLFNAPETQITLVATQISNDIKLLAAAHKGIKLIEKSYDINDLQYGELVLVAVNDLAVSARIRTEAKQLNLLVNVADTPDLCDFYLSSVVKKGDLKIAISTNGKSPTIAKRVKEWLNEAIPNDINQLLHNMQQVRNTLKGDFAFKVQRLNEITTQYVAQKAEENRIEKFGEKKWKRIASYCVFAFFFMIVGYWLFSFVPFGNIWSETVANLQTLDKNFYWMLAAGFFAQLVDGALGMGYGVTCTTVLLSIGVNLPAISGSIHTAEMFSSGASGYSHYKFGNVNKKLFKVLLIPGILGAIGGAYLLSVYGEKYANYIRPVLASYTLILGIRILIVAFRKKKKTSKVKRAGLLAGLGGFLDSFGGGGWGPLVTSTLIAKGRTPKYVIGTVSITEFFVTLASALTFFSLIGLSHWQVIIGLIIGGTVAAPLAAKLSGKLPMKASFIGVGIMVIIWSGRILLKALGIF
ncbi:MAG: TSUP family transporter [Chitinophagaceae bacterium]